MAMPHPVNESAAHVLVADDEPFVRHAFQLYLETNGFVCSPAENGQQALAILRQRPDDVDVLLLDLVMPGMYGIDVLKEAKRIDPTVEVVIATGCGTVHSAIEAMRYGAFDYITKPIVNFEEDLLRVVRSAVAARQRRQSAAQPPVPPVLDSRAAADYFNALEEIAGSLSARPEFDRRLAELLDRSFRADGALLLCRSADGRITPCRRWGRVVDPATLVAGATASFVSTQFWSEVIALTPRWRSICLPIPLLETADGVAANERPLQTLQITVNTGSETGDAAGTYHFVLLRQRDERGPTTAVPPLELLRLVVGESIRRSEARLTDAALEPHQFH